MPAFGATAGAICVAYAAMPPTPDIAGLTEPEPVLAADLFAPERAALLELLRSLDPQSWERPTVCPGWAVRDIAAHLVADDLGRLSRARDGHSPARRRAGEGLVAFVDRQNAEWVDAMRRISPAVLVALLDLGGQESEAYFRSLDPFAVDGPVSWATGTEPAPVWLDLARELTERWHHQSQIRDAVGAPPLTDPALLRPVLATFVRAFTRTFHGIQAVAGTAVTLIVRGESGGAWTVIHEGEGWRLYAGEHPTPTATATIDQDDYWRLVTRGLTPAAVEERSELAGDPVLARQVLTMVSVIS
jgi:uncharacterized protein (TIGR03083 family)